MDATATVDVKAKGQILIGAAMDIPNFVATLDAVGSGSKIAGFTPVFSKTFNASGEVDAKVGLGLPVEVGVGLTVPGE